MDRTYQKAISLSNKGDINSCLSLIRKIINNKKCPPQVYFDYIEVSNRCERLDEAKSRFMGTEACLLSSNMLALTWGAIYLHDKEVWPTISVIDTSLKNDKQLEPILDFLEGSARGKIFQYQKAIELMQRAQRAELAMPWRVLDSQVKLYEVSDADTKELLSTAKDALKNHMPAELSCFEEEYRGNVALWVAEKLLNSNQKSNIPELLKFLNYDFAPPVANLNGAVLAHKLDDENEALRLLLQASSTNVSWFKLIDIDKIKPVIEKLNNINPSNLMLRVRLAEITAVSGNLAEAILMLEENLQLDPNHEATIAPLYQMLCANENQSKSIDFLSKWCSQHPNDEKNIKALIRLLNDADNLKESSKWITRAKRHWPDAIWTIAFRGHINYISKYGSKATTYFNRAIKLGYDAPLTNFELAELTAPNNPQAAILLYEKAGEQLCDNYIPFLNALFCAFTADDAIAAKRFFLQLMVINPNEGLEKISNNILNYFYSLFQEGHKIFGKNDWQFLYYLGLCFGHKQDLDKAIFFTTKSLDINYQYPDSLVLLGRLYFMKEDKNKALASFEQAVSFSPNHATALNMLGRLLVLSEKIDRGVELLTDCCLLMPDDEELREVVLKISNDAKRDDLVSKIRHIHTFSKIILHVTTLFAEHNTENWWKNNSKEALPWLDKVLCTFEGDYEGLYFNFVSDDSDENNNSEEVVDSDKATNSDQLKPVFTLITSDLISTVEDFKEKIKSRIDKKEKLIQAMPKNYRFNVIHRSGIWEQCQKNSIKAIAAGVHINDKGTLVRIAVLWMHCQRVLKKFEQYVVAYVIAGSWIRGDTTSKSDVDFYIVIDDTDVQKMTRTELKDRLRDIVNSQMNAICKEYNANIPFNCQTYILTDFWEGIRNVNPVFYTFLRDGVAFFDKGMFLPWQQLLKAGKLRPTPEAVQMYCDQGKKSFKKAQEHLREIVVEDLYYAALYMTQSVLMALGVAPPSPKESPCIAKKHLIQRQIIIKDPNFFEILDRLISIRKDLEYGVIKLPNISELGELMSLTEEYINKLSDFFPQIEKIGKIQSIVKASGIDDDDVHEPDIWLTKLIHLLPQQMPNESRDSKQRLVAALENVAKYHSQLQENDIVEDELIEFHDSLKIFRQAIVAYRQ